MYMYARDIDFPSASTICLLNFEIAPTMLHFLFFILLLLVRDHAIVYTRE